MVVGFRAGVGAVVCDRAGRVLLFERRQPRGAWQFAQGGIEGDELPELAMWRELREEAGLGPDEVELVHEVPEWLGYELPPDQRNDKTGRGQVQKWFILRARHDGVEPRLDGERKPEFCAWRWADPDAAVADVVAFRRPVYERLRSSLATLDA
jgi:putative (di)nucleoside polyphosphate hydrolase